MVEVPAGASSTIKAGDAIPGQTKPVLSIDSLDLGNGSTLTVAPENSATIVEVDGVASDMGTIAAASGASVRLGGLLEIKSPVESAGLTLEGCVTLGESLAISLPETWKNGDGNRVAIDASEALDELTIDPADVAVLCNGTPVSADRYRIKIVDNQLLLNFDHGTVIMFR